MGAIAGSAILDCSPTSRLDTVTLTINNSCNLKCPHCYLQYDSRDTHFNCSIYPLIAKSTFRHLAIVGKEPFLDSCSLDICKKLLDVCSQSQTTVSVITNGISLSGVPKDFLRRFAFVDVSLDGGRESYQTYRRGSIAKLERSLAWASSSGTKLNALHVLNSETLAYLDDMLTVRNLAPFQRIVFSPYLRTRNHGENTVDVLSLPRLLSHLADSAFQATDGAVLLLHRDHLLQSGVSVERFTEQIDLYGLANRVHLIKNDPLRYGIIRLTYDGLIISPMRALHTQLYSPTDCLNASRLAESCLQDAFGLIQRSKQLVQ